MAGKIKFGMRDNSREIGHTNVRTPDITAATLPGILTTVGVLRTAVEGITLGVVATESLVVNETTLSALAPSNPLAQRGIKWTVSYADTQQWFNPPTNTVPNEGYQQKFTNTIPTADLSLLPDGSEDLDLTTGPGLAFKNAWEDAVRSPYGGEVTVLRVYYSD